MSAAWSWLVVGVGDHDDRRIPALAGAREAAQRLHERLGIGFPCGGTGRLLLNPAAATIEADVRRASEEARPDQVLLCYLVARVSPTGRLQGRDGDPARRRGSGVGLEGLLHLTRRCRARALVLVIDGHADVEDSAWLEALSAIERPGLLLLGVQQVTGDPGRVVDDLLACLESEGLLEERLAAAVWRLGGAPGVAQATLRGEAPGVEAARLAPAPPPLPPARIAGFYQRVGLPTHYVEREELLDELRRAVLGADAGAVAVTSAATALHGMGGIGKTVLARSLCDEPTIRRAYPHGVLWTSLGKEPDLRGRLQDVVTTLGGAPAEAATSLDQLQQLLVDLLRHRACLLIVDDVWTAAHIERFHLPAGLRSRLLFTTRDALLAEAASAKVVRVPPMTTVQALDLLRRWSGSRLAAATEHALEAIAERVQRLPLALALVGAQLQFMDHEEWVRRFDDRIASRLRDLDAARGTRSPEESLQVSFALSLDALESTARALYLRLGIFAERDATPVSAVDRLWSDHLDAARTPVLLRHLRERALVELVGEPGAVRLHDLLRRFALEELGAAGARSAHRGLLDTYEPVGGWPGVLDDGYIHDHLTYHLDALDADPELAALFVDDAWLRARVRQRRRAYDGFTGDLQVARTRAERRAREQLQAGASPTALRDLVRLGLVRAALSDLAGSLSPALVALAVERNVDDWTAARAVAAARVVPAVEARAAIAARALAMEGLDEARRQDAERLALDALEELTAALDREPAPVLDLESPWGYGDRLAAERRVEVGIDALAPHVSGTGLLRLLGAVRSFDRSDQRRRLLSFVPRLRTLKLRPVIDAIFESGDDQLVEAACSAFVEGLDAAAVRDLWQTCLERGGDERPLRIVASALAANDVEELLDRAADLPPEQAARAVAGLAERVPEGRLDDTLAWACELPVGAARRQLLGALAARSGGTGPLQPAASSAGRSAQLFLAVLSGKDGLVEAIGAVADEHERAWLLATLAERCDEATARRAFELALDLEAPSSRAAVFRRLAQRLEERALALGAEGFGELEARLASLSPPQKAPETFGEMFVAKERSDRELVRAARDALLGPGGFRRLLDDVSSWETEPWVRAGLFEVMPHALERDELEEVVDHVLEHMPDEWQQLGTLRALAPRLPVPPGDDPEAEAAESRRLLGKVLDRALSMRHVGHEMIEALQPYLDGHLHMRVWSYGVEHRKGDLVVLALEGLLRRDSAGSALELWEVVVTERSMHRAKLLAACAAHLDPDGVRSALRAALVPEVEQATRLERLAALAPFLVDAEARGVALRIVQALPDEAQRRTLYRRLLPVLSGDAELGAVAADLAGMTGREDAQALFEGLADRLAPQHLRRVLADALRLAAPQRGTAVLSAVGALTSPRSAGPAWVALSSVEAPGGARLNAYRALARCLAPEDVAKLLEGGGDVPDARRALLEAAAAGLEARTSRQAWVAALGRPALLDDLEVQEAIAESGPPTLGARARDATFQAVDWVRRHLVARQARVAPRECLAAALAEADARSQAISLALLLPALRGDELRQGLAFATTLARGPRRYFFSEVLPRLDDDGLRAAWGVALRMDSELDRVVLLQEIAAWLHGPLLRETWLQTLDLLRTPTKQMAIDALARQHRGPGIDRALDDVLERTHESPLLMELLRRTSPLETEEQLARASASFFSVHRARSWWECCPRWSRTCRDRSCSGPGALASSSCRKAPRRCTASRARSAAVFWARWSRRSPTGRTWRRTSVTWKRSPPPTLPCECCSPPRSPLASPRTVRCGA